MHVLSTYVSEAYRYFSVAHTLLLRNPLLCWSFLPVPQEMAPKIFAFSNFCSLISTAKMREAPAFLQPMTAARPTAPSPNTAHTEPGVTFPQTQSITSVKYRNIHLTVQATTIWTLQIVSQNWKSVLWSDMSKFDILVGNHGCHVLRSKEEGVLPACYQRSVQKPASLMVWGYTVWAACMSWKALWMLKGISSF